MRNKVIQVTGAILVTAGGLLACASGWYCPATALPAVGTGLAITGLLVVMIGGLENG